MKACSSGRSLALAVAQTSLLQYQPRDVRQTSCGRSKKGLTVVGFTGRTGGEMASRCDVCLHAPSDSTPLIQQIHIMAGHIICGLVEEDLFPRDA
jgi:hypothetical protein